MYLCNMRILRNLFRYMLRAVLLLFLGALFWMYWNYGSSPVYSFSGSNTFMGDAYYNPYEHINKENWRIGNFQAQSAAWVGITAGQQNSNQEICEIYSSLGYDFITISDYQKINQYICKEGAYIPVYEHGYGIFKNHQVVVGAHRVLWRDYPLYQNINHKQHILDLLMKENDLVYIAHPDFANGNDPEELQILSNYTGIEFLSIYTNSSHYWDAALTSGKYVTGMANDDLHDIRNTNQIGRFCNFINTRSTQRSDVIDAMRKGQSYAAAIHWEWKEPIEKKVKRFKELPSLQAVKILGDTLFVALSDDVNVFRFIGDSGILKKEVQNNDSAFYVFGQEDSYIRVEVETAGKSIFYLNPVCRSIDGKQPMHTPLEINTLQTMMKRVVYGIILLLLLFGYFLLRKKKSVQ